MTLLSISLKELMEALGVAVTRIWLGKVVTRKSSVFPILILSSSPDNPGKRIMAEERNPPSRSASSNIIILDA